MRDFSFVDIASDASYVLEGCLVPHFACNEEDLFRRIIPAVNRARVDRWEKAAGRVWKPEQQESVFSLLRVRRSSVTGEKGAAIQGKRRASAVAPASSSPIASGPGGGEGEDEEEDFLEPPLIFDFAREDVLLALSLDYDGFGSAAVRVPRVSMRTASAALRSPWAPRPSAANVSARLQVLRRLGTGGAQSALADADAAWDDEDDGGRSEGRVEGSVLSEGSALSALSGGTVSSATSAWSEGGVWGGGLVG